MFQLKKNSVLSLRSKGAAFCSLSLLLVAAPSMASDRVVGANASLDIEPGARSAALGSATMAVDGDYLGLMSNAYQLTSVKHLWASFSHTAYFEDSKFDFASAVIPLSDGQGLGVALSRFGADDIPYIREGDPIPEGSDYNTLSIADWIVSVSWGRRLMDKLDLGVAFHILYRDMDQSGWGFRGDVSARYWVRDDLAVSALLKGWTSSAVTWDSGEFEYSAPELYLAASYSLPVSYLYGKFNFYWQSAGLFHHDYRDLELDEDEHGGDRIWEDPIDWLSGGRGGIEFNFDFGLSLRVGLSSFTTFKSVTAGAGLTVARFVKIDYAFESHPVFSPVHRVSVSVCPYLFGHVPAENSGHLKVNEAAKKVLTEETESGEAEYVESQNVEPQNAETPATETATAETAPVEDAKPAPAAANEPPASAGKAPSSAPKAEEKVETPPAVRATPVVETDDEILE